MSVQTEIDRIKNCVSEQTQLIEQIKTVLEKKASGKKDLVTVEISSTINVVLHYPSNEDEIVDNTTRLFSIEKGSIIFLRPKNPMDVSSYNAQISSGATIIGNSKDGVVISISDHAEGTIRVYVSVMDVIPT